MKKYQFELFSYFDDKSTKSILSIFSTKFSNLFLLSLTNTKRVPNFFQSRTTCISPTFHFLDKILNESEKKNLKHKETKEYPFLQRPFFIFVPTYLFQRNFLISLLAPNEGKIQKFFSNCKKRKKERKKGATMKPSRSEPRKISRTWSNFPSGQELTFRDDERVRRS